MMDRKSGLWTAFVLMLFVLVIGGCATTRLSEPFVDYNGEYDFSAVKSVGMYRESGEVSGENPHQLSDMARDRVDLALKRALEAKGLAFSADAGEADLLLSWHLVTETRTDVRSVETPVVAGVYYSPRFHPYNRYSRYSCWTCVSLQTEVSVREYTSGTFIVDLIDPELDKSVWRSVTTTRLRGQPSREQDRYDAAAAHVLASFPPGI
jgi:hypothetical protein